MTRRQQAIDDAARHLVHTTPRTVECLTWEDIVEALSEVGMINVVDDYDWDRLESAIRRRHEAIWDIKRRAEIANQRA